jgi:hypothetical protein
MDTLRGLSTVRVSKDFLLEKLETNRKEHKAIYEKAMQGWHLQIIDTLKKELKKVKIDKEYQPKCFVVKPGNHVKEYDRTIDLLKASLDEEFVLTSSEFSQYVRDEWGWKDVFMTTVSGCLDYKVD